MVKFNRKKFLKTPQGESSPFVPPGRGPRASAKHSLPKSRSKDNKDSNRTKPQHQGASIKKPNANRNRKTESTKSANVATTATTPTTTTVVVERKIEKDEIAQLPRLFWKGPTRVLKDRREIRHAVSTLMQETVLGFDTETKPVFRRGQFEPPALVQLAGREQVYLFRILDGTLDLLVPLLEAKHILKVGVSVKQDVKELQGVVRFTPGGFVELADRTKPLGYLQTGLRALTAMILGGNLCKRMQMSNWANPVLSPGQVTYAATDAWVGRELYLKILQEEKRAQKSRKSAA